MDQERRAIRPLERVVVFLGCLVILGVAAQIAMSIAGQGSFLDINSPAGVCISTSAGNVTPVHNLHVRDLAPGVRGVAETIRLCKSDPTTWERTLDAIDRQMPFLFSSGVLFILWRLLRQARLRGVFIEPFARRLTGLGVYVLLGTFATSAVHAWTNWELQKVMVIGGGAWDGWMYSIPALLVGFGLITVGRIMRETVPMREELDATV